MTKTPPFFRKTAGFLYMCGNSGRQILRLRGRIGLIRAALGAEAEVDDGGEDAGGQQHQIAAHRPAGATRDAPNTKAKARRNTFSAAPAAPGRGR